MALSRPFKEGRLALPLALENQFIYCTATSWNREPAGKSASLSGLAGMESASDSVTVFLCNIK